MGLILLVERDCHVYNAFNATEFLTLLFADDTTFQFSDVNIDTLFEKCNNELEKLQSGLKQIS